MLESGRGVVRKKKTIADLLRQGDLNEVARRIYEVTGQAPSVRQLQQMARAAEKIKPAIRPKRKVKELELD